ncbi:MAG: DUF4097 domain-containing protein [Rhodothermales bacterium]
MRTARFPFLALFMVVLTAIPFSTAAAQQVRILEDDPWCERHRWSDDWDTERYCEVHEITLQAGRDLIAIDGRQNGGIRVKGWNKDEILVRARIRANARSESAARRLAEEVEIETGRTIYAEGPDTRRKEWISVSYEVFVPHQSNLLLETHNGGIHIEDVDGDVEFDALNGGVSLIDLAGDIQGRTTNGGLDIELTGTEWNGEGMDVTTTNGGITIIVPDEYSARLETRTVNGRLEVDFPVLVQGRIDRRITTELGRGGRTIRAVTTNGGVEVRRG